MENYSEPVAKIVDDYLDRVASHLRQVPVGERDEFLCEIQSHLYEAYQNSETGDDISRILAVLRNFGEPADVVCERLPQAMVRSGAKRNLPLIVLGGILIALFGVPLGVGGAGVLIGILAALAGIMIAWYAAAGSVLLVSVVFMLLGVIRYQPALWDHLVNLGLIRIDYGPLADFLGQFSPAGQGFLMVVISAVFAACGAGMLRAGKYLLRGLRFLASLGFDWTRRTAQRLRGTARQGTSAGFSSRRTTTPASSGLAAG